MSIYIGYVLAILVGISLGLIGSGGSILTIPILVYIMGISPSQATSYSLFIVGIAAIVGSISGIKNGLFDKKLAIYFGLPGVISIFIMRKFLLPLVPTELFSVGSFLVTKDLLIMIVFAILMILASISMIKGRRTADKPSGELNVVKIIVLGVMVGLITGFVGVGGGFLIIPVLVFSAGLSMKNAVATSLIIISINALIGFAGTNDLSQIDWVLLLVFTSLSVLGTLLGTRLSTRISNEKLKPGFGWFVLISGFYILIKETLIE